MSSSNSLPMPTQASELAGNATTEQKEACLLAMTLFNYTEGIFAHSVGTRIRVTEVSFEPFGKYEQSKVVCTITVEPGMS